MIHSLPVAPGFWAVCGGTSQNEKAGDRTDIMETSNPSLLPPNPSPHAHRKLNAVVPEDKTLQISKSWRLNFYQLALNWSALFYRHDEKNQPQMFEKDSPKSHKLVHEFMTLTK